MFKINVFFQKIQVLGHIFASSGTLCPRKKSRAQIPNRILAEADQ